MVFDLSLKMLAHEPFWKQKLTNATYQFMNVTIIHRSEICKISMTIEIKLTVFISRKRFNQFIMNKL